jgi:hypothetical protein
MIPTTFARVVEEMLVTQLAPPGAWESSGLAQVRNEGTTPVRLLNALPGTGAPNAQEIVDVGQTIPATGIPLGNAMNPSDPSNTYLIVEPGYAPGPAAAISVGADVCADDGTQIIAGTFVETVNTVPAVSSDVTVVCRDVTSFTGLSAGQHVLCAGGMYSLVSVSGTTGGSLTLEYLGAAGARVPVAMT